MRQDLFVQRDAGVEWADRGQWAVGLHELQRIRAGVKFSGGSGGCAMHDEVHRGVGQADLRELFNGAPKHLIGAGLQVEIDPIAAGEMQPGLSQDIQGHRQKAMGGPDRAGCVPQGHLVQGEAALVQFQVQIGAKPLELLLRNGKTAAHFAEQRAVAPVRGESQAAQIQLAQGMGHEALEKIPD